MAYDELVPTEIPALSKRRQELAPPTEESVVDSIDEEIGVELAALTEEEVPQEAPPQEETQVAGGPRALTEIIKAIGRAAKPKPSVVAPTIESIVKQESDVIHARPASEVEVQSFITEMGLQDTHDFDFENIRTGEDLELARKAMSKMIAPQIEESRRGVVKHEQTVQMANDLDILPRVLKKKIGEAFNAEEITATRMLRYKSEQRTDQLARKVMTPEASDVDMLEFRRQMTLHALIEMQFLGARAEIGRALNAFNIDIEKSLGMGEGAVPQGQQDERTILMLDQFGGSTTTRKLAQKWLSINSTHGKSKLAHGSWAARAEAVFFEAWINGLLSGGRTHMRNTVGNTMFKMWSIPETAIAGTIGAVRSGTNIALGEGPLIDRVFMMEAVAELYGNLLGIEDGFRLGANAIVTGEASDPVSKIENQQYKSITGETFGMTGKTGKAVDYLGTAIRVPGLALMAGDEFFKAVAGRGHLYRLAYRRAQEALANGSTPEEAAEIATEAIVNPDDQLQMDVTQAARYYTYTDEIEGKINEAVQAFQRVPVIGRFIIPFRRTPLNLIKRFSERTPVFAWMMPSVREDFMAGGAKRDTAIARLVLGSAALTIAGMWAYEDKITGGGPPDPRKRAMLRGTGWQPWSFKVKKGEGWVSDATLLTLKALGMVSEDPDHIYISYQGLDPMSGFLAISADTADGLKYTDDLRLGEDLAGIALSATTGFFKDRSFFRGLSDVSAAMRYGPKAFNRYISRVAGSLKPFSSLVRDLERIGDPIRRDTRVDPDAPIVISQFYAALNGWKEGVPGLSKSLPPMHNYMGEVVKIGDSPTWWDLVNPFYVSPKKYAPLEKEMISLGIPFGVPRPMIGGIPLNSEEHQRYIELQGAVVIPERYTATQRIELEKTIMDPDYRLMPEKEKYDHLRNIHADYLEKAVEQLVIEYPDLGMKIEMHRILREEGIMR